MYFYLIDRVDDIVHEVLASFKFVKEEQVRLGELKIQRKVELFDQLQTKDVQAGKNPAAAAASLRGRLSLSFQGVGIGVGVGIGNGLIPKNVSERHSTHKVACQARLLVGLQQLRGVIIDAGHINLVGGFFGRHVGGCNGTG